MQSSAAVEVPIRICTKPSFNDMTFETNGYFVLKNSLNNTDQLLNRLNEKSTENWDEVFNSKEITVNEKQNEGRKQLVLFHKKKGSADKDLQIIEELVTDLKNQAVSKVMELNAVTTSRYI